MNNGGQETGSLNGCCFYVVISSKLPGRKSNLSSHEVMKSVLSNVSEKSKNELYLNNFEVTESSSVHCNENVIYKLTLDSVSEDLKREIFRVVKGIEKTNI